MRTIDVRLDPRVYPMIERWMVAFHMSDYEWKLRPLSKKARKTAWAIVEWNIEDKVAIFGFGPTVGLTDDDLEAIVVHECLHGVFHLARSCNMGSTIDEQLCNLFAKLFVPNSARPFKLIADVKPQWATATARKWFSDEEREALTDVLPYLLMRLSTEQVVVLKGIFYDNDSLRDIAAKVGVDQKTVRNRAEAGLKELRTMMQDTA